MESLPTTPSSRRIDRAVRAIGNAVSWVWALLLVVIVSNVILRYVFGSGRIEFEELQWHLYAVGFLVGLSYAYESDTHVRVDLLRERLGVRHQAWLELYGILLLLLPFVALVAIYSLPFTLEAWRSAEVSQAPGGLPFRWLIKAVMPVGFLLLGLSAISRLLRVCALLFATDDAREAR